MNHTPNPVLDQAALSPHSVRRVTKPVNFYCYPKSDAKSVRLIGDFNNWNPNSSLLQRRPDGWWFIQMPLTHGHHPYCFWWMASPPWTREPPAPSKLNLLARPR